MIQISNAFAEEIKLILSNLRNMTKEIPGNRAANMRRRAKLIENYITKKQQL